MKKIIVLTGLILSGCSTLSTNLSNFHGDSTTDQVLKNDVIKTILPALSVWHGDNCRKIDRIDSRILSVDQNPQGQLREVVEGWTVQACNIRKTYRVSLRPDAQGEVDYSVRFPPE